MNWQDLDDEKPEPLQFCTHCERPIMGLKSRDLLTGQVYFKCRCGMEYNPRYNPKTGKCDWLPRNH